MNTEASDLAGSEHPSWADLKALERTQERNPTRPPSLPLASIKLAPRVFQHRLLDSEPLATLRHVNELKRVVTASIRDKGTPLDKLIVTPIGHDFYLVDGHQRYKAYVAANWKRVVPVFHFAGNLEDARDHAMRVNAKGKLLMNLESRCEYAWTLVKEGNKTRKEIAELTLVSERQVAYMRARLKRLPDCSAMSWREALRGHTVQARDRTDWISESADKLVDQLLKNTGGKFIERPEILALALSKINPELPAALIREWWTEVREVAAELEEQDDGTEQNVELLDI